MFIALSIVDFLQRIIIFGSSSLGLHFEKNKAYSIIPLVQFNVKLAGAATKNDYACQIFIKLPGNFLCEHIFLEYLFVSLAAFKILFKITCFSHIRQAIVEYLCSNIEIQYSSSNHYLFASIYRNIVFQMLHIYKVNGDVDKKTPL